jgi:hypothetical protein
LCCLPFLFAMGLKTLLAFSSKRNFWAYRNMAELVYLLGAGANQIVDWHGLKPPLANNFFQMALQSDKFSDKVYSERIAPVYDYISHFWKKGEGELRNEPFGLEDCFTMLQLQQNEAGRSEDYNEYGRLAGIEFLLESFLAEYLAEFETFAITSDLMRQFGVAVYREKPIVLTLNYDCILEAVIELASGVNVSMPQSFREGTYEQEEIPDDELPYSHHNWNRPLAYGIKFDEVQLQRAGLPTYANGGRFYNHPENKLYSWRILKLHGSLNWFQYLRIRKYPSFDLSDMELPEEKLREVLMVRGRWWFVAPPDLRGWLLKPLIITPVLYKEQFYQHPVFSDIWRQALNELSTCKRLVVVGYSFAPTDFNIRKLFLEAFGKSHLKELIVVDPNTSVVQIVKELTHFDKPVLVCRDLKEYLEPYVALETHGSEQKPPKA